MTHCFLYESVFIPENERREKDKGRYTLWLMRTFDSRIILVHKVALDELDSEGRFSDTWKRRRLSLERR